MNECYDYYECGICLIMFKEHNGQTDLCNLCYKSLIGFEDLEDVYVHEDDYALEVDEFDEAKGAFTI